MRDGRLVLDEPTELPDGTLLELVSTDDVLSNGGDLLDAEERAELDRDLEQSFVDEKAGRLIDADDALAELRANPSMASADVVHSNHIGVTSSATMRRGRSRSHRSGP